MLTELRTASFLTKPFSKSSRSFPLVAAAMLAMSATRSAMADPIFVSGSTFQVQAVNAPDTFTNNASLPGTSSLDSGALSLTTTIVPVPSSSSEWVVFTYNTSSGRPLGQQGSYFELFQTGVDLAVPANFTQGFFTFTTNGVAQTPTSSPFSNYTPGADPVPGATGNGEVATGFVISYPSGPLPTLGTYDSNYSVFNNNGFNTNTANGYVEALLFTPQSPVPEPASLAAFGVPTAMALLRRRRKAI